jgi:hypothetical protein
MHIQPDQSSFDPGYFSLRTPSPARAEAKAEAAVASVDSSKQELADLAKQLQSVTGIFRPYEEGRDEAAAARTARLAERFESLSLRTGSELSAEMLRVLAVVQAAQDGLPATSPSAALSEAYRAKEPPAPGFSEVG